MKKTLAIALLMLVTLFALTGCSTYFAYTFNVENGDSIKVQLDTGKGHQLKQSNGNFFVLKDDAELTRGMFLLEDVCQEYFDTLPTQEGITMLDEGEADGNDYMLFLIDGDEEPVWYHVIRVADSKTGIMLRNMTSQEEAEELFALLTLKKA